MAVLSLYNHLLFNKKVEVELSPLYDFKNKTMAGYANINFNFYFNKLFRKATLGVKSARFAYNSEPEQLNYNKIAPHLILEFKKKNLRTPIKQFIKIRTVILLNEEIKYVKANENADYLAKKVNNQTVIPGLTYQLINNRTIDPFNLTMSSEFIDELQKLSATFNYSISVSERKKISFRLFAGKMIGSNNNGDYRFRMSGQAGYQDYLYDNFYFGRNASLPNISAQQFTETDGAFKVYSPLGQSDDWLIACNIKTPKIFKLPFYIFADAGMYNATGLKTPELLYSMGISLPLIKDIIEIYFPILNSKNIDDVQALNNINRYADKIRFTFYLNRANPFELIKNNLPF
jgi:hypothetical protein